MIQSIVATFHDGAGQIWASLVVAEHVNNNFLSDDNNNVALEVTATHLIYIE